MENKTSIGFGLRKITTEQFAIIESAYNKDNAEIRLGNTLRFGVNAEKRMVTVLLSVQFSQENNPFLILQIGCQFEIASEHWQHFYKLEEESLTLPLAFARHLVVLAMGTLRGVLHAKTENTSFNKYLLPTINITELVKEDVKISKPKLAEG